MLITHLEVRRHPQWQHESTRCLTVREHLNRANRATRRQHALAAALVVIGILLAATG